MPEPPACPPYPAATASFRLIQLRPLLFARYSALSDRIFSPKPCKKVCVPYHGQGLGGKPFKEFFLGKETI